MTTIPQRLDVAEVRRQGHRIDWRAESLPFTPAADSEAELGREGRTPGELAAVPLAEFMVTVSPEVSWLVSGLVPFGGLVLLVSYMKTGKSTLLYALLAAVLRGAPFLGQATQRVPVLLLAVEEHPRDVRRRLERFGAPVDAPLFIHAAPLRNTPEALAELREFILGHGIRLVVVDTLSRFWTVRDENDNAEVERQVSPLLDLARELDVTALVAHHAGKAGGSNGREIRGASSLFGLADQALLLDRRHGGSPSERLVRVLGRYDESPAELVVKLEGDAFVVLGDPSELDIAARVRQLAEALTREPQTVKDLAAAADLSERNVRKLLPRIDGLILEGEGKKNDPTTARLK